VVKVIVHEKLEKFGTKVDKFELIVRFFGSLRQIPESQRENIEVFGFIVVKNYFVCDFRHEFWAFGEGLKKIPVFIFDFVESTLNVRLLVKWQSFELVNHCFDILDVSFIPQAHRFG